MVFLIFDTATIWPHHKQARETSYIFWADDEFYESIHILQKQTIYGDRIMETQQQFSPRLISIRNPPSGRTCAVLWYTSRLSGVGVCSDVHDLPFKDKWPLAERNAAGDIAMARCNTGISCTSLMEKPTYYPKDSIRHWNEFYFCGLRFWGQWVLHVTYTYISGMYHWY